jgi:hypothetical protein
MAKKIEGYGLEVTESWSANRPTGSNANWQKATLVIGEKAYAESEVKAILHDMRSWISPDDGEEGRMWETRAKLHGIVLDPA